MACTRPPTLRQRIGDNPSGQWLRDRAAKARVTDLRHGTSLGGRLGELAGRSVLVAAASQLTTALTLIELDGVARRALILPPDTDPAHLGALIAGAEIDAAVVDRDGRSGAAFDRSVVCTPEIEAAERLPAATCETEWLLLTSGTSGVPKIVSHSLASLTAPIKAKSADSAVVWATFYDIRRYGGLQIFLRAVLGGASLVLANAGETVAEHLARLAQNGVTHLSGTPSHWRRALMSPAIREISPRYVRLSGEIADQAVLDGLRRAFPDAKVGHAYASTEAGVAFEVDDGLAGFPASYLDAMRDGVALKLEDGSLRVRSPLAASRYVGSATPLAAPDGFVDTGDMVELSGDRYFFAGRRGGIINIGGQKVHPEEIEAVINRHPKVRMSLVRPKRSPVTGSVVIADVVLESGGGGEAGDVKGEILEFCRAALPRHKVPAAISFVAALDVAASGKLVRRRG